MSDQALATPNEHRPAQPRSKSGRALTITRKVRTAIEHMVWGGLDRAKAAEAAGLKDNSLYIAMRKADVKAFYLAECEVLRTSGRARRIHRLEELSEQDENKAAAVAALKTLDQVQDEQQSQIGRQSVAGLVLILGSGSVADMGHIREIEAKPLIQQKVVPHEE